MAIKKSVRLVDETCRLLHELTLAGETNWSGSINQMAEQYKLLVSDSLPKLSEREKSAILCCYNGYIPPPNVEQEVEMLAWNLDQSYQYDIQVTDLLGTPEDACAFIEKVKGWSISEKIAVIYTARSFWRQGPKAGITKGV